jgi:hypothetical protein
MPSVRTDPAANAMQPPIDFDAKTERSGREAVPLAVPLACTNHPCIRPMTMTCDFAVAPVRGRVAGLVGEW